MHKVAVIVGSKRPASVNRKLARAIAKLAAPKLAFTFVDIAGLPMYDDDLWQDPPAGVLRFKAEVEAADAVLIATPEYNRSIPALLKNAIDWGSRPYGKSSWTGKPTAVIGASPGVIGTAAAQQHLKAIVPVLGGHLLPQPEVYFSMRPGLIDDNDEVTNADTKAFLEGFVAKFAAFVALMRPAG
ncbi:NADPH-dependent FMN reductase [Chelatococcus reniformis]|uniref:FMN reductase n=1 Tax=Chelatococcus reniformis TaxID=1494448 RepID=A0A916UA07_9HYPH|nr:FMN reductase [Chelatococcus reniformis]